MLITHPDNQSIGFVRRRYAAFFSAFALYWVACTYCLFMSDQSAGIATAWYANIIVVIFLQVSPYRDWPVYLVLAALANALGRYVAGSVGWMNFLFIPGNLLEISLTAYVLRRYIPLPKCSSHPLQLLKLFTLILIPNLLSALIGALAVHCYDATPYGEAFISFFTSSLIGNISILPLGMLLIANRDTAFKDVTHFFSFFITILIAVLTALLSFVYLPDPYVYVSTTLIIVAMIGRFTGTAIAVFSYSLIIGWLISFGFFTPTIQGNYVNSEYLLFLPLIVTLFQPLLLAAAMERIYYHKPLW